MGASICGFQFSNPSLFFKLKIFGEAFNIECNTGVSNVAYSSG